MITNYLQDPLKATWIGGCNIVSVEDVAEGHLLAAEKGEPGTRYLVGSENLNWADVHRMLSGLTGLPGPLMTANHTSSYLAATWYEMVSHFTGEAPLTSRNQAKMVGKYYWYDCNRIHQLGYQPRSALQALAEAVSWLVTSEHISSDLRAQMKLAPEVYAARQKTIRE